MALAGLAGHLITSFAQTWEKWLATTSWRSFVQLYQSRAYLELVALLVEVYVHEKAVREKARENRRAHSKQV